MPSVIRNILFCGCLRKNKKESTKVVENVAFDTVQKNKQVKKIFVLQTNYVLS